MILKWHWNCLWNSFFPMLGNIEQRTSHLNVFIEWGSMEIQLTPLASISSCTVHLEQNNMLKNSVNEIISFVLNRKFRVLKNIHSNYSWYFLQKKPNMKIRIDIFDISFLVHFFTFLFWFLIIFLLKLKLINKRKILVCIWSIRTTYIVC